MPEDMLNQIFAPGMKMLASSRRSGEEVEVIDTDPKDADSQRITKYNDLWADRRKELYRFLLN
ncbi:TPA: hypothetical protein EYP75_05045 [Candidatus Bathyarchaeota archaeon]|nr:hypothetical protein [Candidatus Bathyarchaeota archaeon]